MKTETSGLTATVVDGGMFVELAVRLARDFKRVFYCCDIQPAYPRLNEACVGDGINGVETIDSPWEKKSETDLFVFPDCSHPELQRELKSQGFPVWGSGSGCQLEWDRIGLKSKLKSVKLPVRPYTVCHGLAKLREFLADKTDQYVKLSKWRGNGETWHWISPETCAGKLDAIAVEFGSLQDEVEFLVEAGFDAEEVGYDGYFVGGKWPVRSFHGIEKKDKSYFGALVEYDDLPEPLREVNDAITPLLAKAGYANFFSSEVRITEDSLPYFTDPTCRLASPAGEVMLEAFDNLAEIVWAGAHGVCVDPDANAKFAAQALIEHNGEDKAWRSLEVPDAIRQWVKLYNVAQVGEETYALPPLPHSSTTVGSVLGLGDTPEEAVEALQAHAEALGDQPVTVEVMSLAEALLDVKEADGETMELGGADVPDPASMMEE